MYVTPTLGRWCGLALLPLLAACTPDVGASVRELTEYQDGIITFYDADGSGACSYEPSPEDMNVAAMNEAQLYGTATCGACVQLEGPLGQLIVRVVDRCPSHDCGPGHLDLSPEAFAKLARPEDGRVKVRWKIIPCATQGPVRYRFKEGSSQWWTAIQVRNHRIPVVKLEWRKGDTWVEMKREDFNYFIEPKGVGEGPVRLRVTAMDGQVLEDTLPGVQAGQLLDGARQFNPD